MERGSEEPMTVIACENMEFGSSKLFESVKEHLSAAQLDYCERYIGFPDAEVSRMVMPIEDENPLTVKVEQYQGVGCGQREGQGRPVGNTGH